MSTKIQDQSREQIAEFLPEAIRIALNSYQTYSIAGDTTDEAKFKNHHAACKIAISHIDLLLKLARWADLPGEEVENKDQQTILVAAIEEARKELKGYEGLTTGDTEIAEDE